MSKCHSGAPGVDSEQRVSQSLALGTPRARRSYRSVARRQGLFESAKKSGVTNEVAHTTDRQAEGYASRRNMRTLDYDLQRTFKGAQDHMLPTGRIDEDVLDIWQSRDLERPGMSGHGHAPYCQQGGLLLYEFRQPNRAGIGGDQPWVGESSKGPTPPRGADAREVA